MKLQTTLKVLRASKGMKQEQMAKILGITTNSYNQKENCIRDFTLKEAKMISEMIGKSIEEIFFEN